MPFAPVFLPCACTCTCSGGVLIPAVLPHLSLPVPAASPPCPLCHQRFNVEREMRSRGRYNGRGSTASDAQMVVGQGVRLASRRAFPSRLQSSFAIVVFLRVLVHLLGQQPAPMISLPSRLPRSQIWLGLAMAKAAATTVVTAGPRCDVSPATAS